MLEPISAIDLFCGAGGLTHGLVRAGVKVVAGYDIAAQCAYAYEKNNSGAQFILKDVAEVKGQELIELWNGAKIRLLAGCAPCQPFSNYRQGKSTESDDRYPLMREFSRLIEETMPELVTMENVPNVESKGVFQNFCEKLAQLGYAYNITIVKCEHCGVAQKRRRMVLLASRISSQAPQIKLSTQISTVRNALEHLPMLGAGQIDPLDSLHRCASLSELNTQRIQASTPGGTWHDWPDGLKLKCHLKKTGSGYTPVYGRLEWDKPAPTLTTQCYNYGSGRFGHPEQDRALSAREAALLQGFPMNYEFESHPCQFSLSHLAKMIGNAVPVGLGEAVGATIQKFLTEITTDAD